MTEREILDKIIELRKQRKISQRKLAARIGISTTYLSMIERGRSILSLWRFVQICEALEVKPHRILESSNKNPEREEVLMTIVKDLFPEDMELLVVLAQTLRDRRDLRS